MRILNSNEEPFSLTPEILSGPANSLSSGDLDFPLMLYLPVVRLKMISQRTQMQLCKSKKIANFVHTAAKQRGRNYNNNTQVHLVS